MSSLCLSKERKALASLAVVKSIERQLRDDATAAHVHESKRKARGSHPADPGLFETLGRWAHDMGLSLWDVFELIELPKANRSRILKGRGSHGDAARIEECLVAYAKAAKIKLDSMPRDKDKVRPAVPLDRMSPLRDWIQIGYEIATDRPEQLPNLIIAVRHTISLLPDVPRMGELIRVSGRKRRPPTPRKRSGRQRGSK